MHHRKTEGYSYIMKKRHRTKNVSFETKN